MLDEWRKLGAKFWGGFFFCCCSLHCCCLLGTSFTRRVAVWWGLYASKIWFHSFRTFLYVAGGWIFVRIWRTAQRFAGESLRMCEFRTKYVWHHVGLISWFSACATLLYASVSNGRLGDWSGRFVILCECMRLRHRSCSAHTNKVVESHSRGCSACCEW